MPLGVFFYMEDFLFFLMSKHKYLITATLSLSLCSCSTWQKPSASQEDKLRDQYFCEKEAHQRWYQGDRLWGFTFIGVIEGTIETDDFYNRCMKIKGWTEKSPDKAERDAENYQSVITQANSSRKICFSKLRSNPKYIDILSHLPDSDKNEFTFFQTSDTKIPSETESYILADYFTAASQCHNTYISTIQPLLSPLQRKIYAQREIEHNTASAELSRRKISYGEWAQRENESLDKTRIKLQ